MVKMLSKIFRNVPNCLKQWNYQQPTICTASVLQDIQNCRPENQEKSPIPCFVAIRLQNKSLLRVSGPESFIYLQSILTNDMRKLLTQDELNNNGNFRVDNQIIGQSVIYTYLLSAVGRVLCDMFIYRGRFHADGEYVLEVDHKLAKAIKRLLLGYNVNKSIKVEIADDLKLWSVIPSSILTNGKLSNNNEILEPIYSDDIKLVADPRIGSHYFGYRFLTRLGGSELEQIGKYIHGQSSSKRIRLIEGHISDYVRLKYRLGIAEGGQDIMSGHHYPFELNGDFLNSVSLDKGLYTSEEKLIKIYSKQPIKQRIFPIEFLCKNQTLRQLSPAPQTLIHSTNKQQKIGQLIRRIGKYGIASLFVPMENNFVRFRPESNLKWNLLHIDTDLKLAATVPDWWPHNFDQIHLDAPEYPKCLFNLKPSTENTINLNPI